MRIRAVLALTLVAVPSTREWAADSGAPAADRPALAISLDASAGATLPEKPAELRLARVTGWIRERVPACPPEAAVSAAQHFLEEMQTSHPEQVDRLLAADFPVRDAESMLLRTVGAQLSKPTVVALREEVARRRIEAVFARTNSLASAATPSGADLLAKIKSQSQVQYRRVIEGRTEDDDLVLLLKKAAGGDTKPTAATSTQPKALTAAAIVSEFVQHNQVGSALSRLRAYTIEGRLKTATGEEQRLLLFKMRPNRFRLVVLADRSPRLIIAGDGQHLWQQAPGQPPRILTAEEMGERRYLGEFVDPLFGAENYSYERLADSTAGDGTVYRIGVRRPDGSNYVARIDPKTFQVTGREDAGGSTARYGDFRTVAGVTFAFHEEATDKEGRKGAIEVTRISPNPGLIEDLFEPPVPGDQNYFVLAQFLARSSSSASSSSTPAK